MRMWGVFLVKASGLDVRRQLKETLVTSLARDPGVHQLVFGDAGRHGLTIVKIAEFDGASEEWDWYAAHRTLAARLAKAAKAPAYAVLCVNGAAYEEWVLSWGPRGKRWASRAADTSRVFKSVRALEDRGAKKAELEAARARTPFGRLAKELDVSLWKLVDLESGDPLDRWT